MESNRLATLPGKHQIAFRTAGVALGSSLDQVLWTNLLGRTVRISEVKFLAEAAATGDNTNNFELGIVNKGSTGAGTTQVCPQKEYVTGTDLTAYVADDIPVSATAADRDVDDGESIAFSKTENNAGLALPIGTVIVLFEFR